MKATLEFNLPEDESEHVRAVNASAAWSALYDIEGRIRNILKYGLNEESSYEQELTEIRREINEITALIGSK
jgi:hypothetical protein